MQYENHIISQMKLIKLVSGKELFLEQWKISIFIYKGG